MEYKFSDNINSLKPSAIREILKTSGNAIPLSAGNPATEAFPEDYIIEITADILKNNAVTALQYSITEGYQPLKDEITYLAKNRYGIDNEGDGIIITSGAQQVMNLSAKAFCNSGDTVICESPSFIGSLNSFRSYGLKLRGVPMKPDGMDIDELEKALKESENVRFIYTIPNFQNPTGYTTSLEKRHKIYELAQKYDVLIIEDDPYGELRFAGEFIPPIKSFDTDGRVVYSGSMSKIISPGLRVGFAIANEEIIQKFAVCKQCDDVHTAVLPQMIAYELISKYDFENHIQSLKKIYKRRATLMTDLADKYLKDYVEYHKPDGGLFLWCTLPDHIDIKDFVKKALDNGVAVVPGFAFAVSEDEPCHSIRLNYSTPSEEQIKTAMKVLGDLIRKECK